MGEGLIVPGLKNLGDTCYINSSLQALASCQTLVRQLKDALRSSSSTDQAAPGSAAATAATDACQTLGGRAAGSSTAQPPLDTGNNLLPLTAALLEVLQLLQPQPTSTWGLRSVTPRRLLDVLRAKLPPGVLADDEQQDAAEAVSLLCDLVAEELQAAFCLQMQPQLAARVALAAVLAAHGSARQDLQCCNGTAPCSESSSTSGSSSISAPPAPPATAGHDAVLWAWQQHARLSLQGSIAHELQCLRCRHRSVVQLAPFWVLPLAIPTAHGTTLLGNVPVAVGAALEGCLAAFFGYEALQGWHCTRCSLAASLDAAGATLMAAAMQQGSGGQQARDAVVSAAAAMRLSELRQTLEGGGQLIESEAIRRMLADAGLAWVPRPCPAARRAVAAQLPAALVLQLRRSFWSHHGQVKVCGHVAFPLCLRLPRTLVPLLGHGEAVPEEQPEEQQPASAPLYLLRAVVVHHGALAAAGHYTVFRWLAGPGDGGGGGSWVRASDEAVQAMEVLDVLRAEASILVYEAC